MKKALFLMLACTFVVGSLALAACGDDDDAVDNVGACEDLVDTLNGLECTPEGYDWGIDCSVYGETTCDIADYFNCLSDCYSCEEDVLTFDADKYSNECLDLANCA